ncbi:phage tail tube protein [Polynucleobacter sp. AP-Nino-20-G2]|uniref:Phage tail tube protein 3 n=1 Tax=uncultured Caudovirales phage TaxID=2100421 RepID=A0A6J5KH76_9CAUD|nr:phage tail tube protein [Polynucleobacter sp. AP-Nino-20-G2]QWE17314.1 hypothetical protein FD960_03615 [Polynucleobacter sp. AP-Nino-20-G2]CAB4121374.1 Phage tail tube protein 3 [uncultured Caudovirales phage]
MTSTAIPAQGTTFSIDTSISGGPSFTAISNIKTFSGFDGSASEIDVTNLSSPAKEVRPGLEDNGQFTLELDRDFSDAGQTALLAARDSQAGKQFKLLLPNGENAIFTGYVKKFSMAGGVDQVVKGSVDIRISGSVTWAGM